MVAQAATRFAGKVVVPLQKRKKAYAALWGGVGRTTGIDFLHSPSLQRAPSNPPALGLGFDAWGHSRETRELAGAVGEGATPCTDGRPSETTPAWIASHQSSLPNAAKGYPPREPRERLGTGLALKNIKSPASLRPLSRTHRRFVASQHRVVRRLWLRHTA